MNSPFHPGEQALHARLGLRERLEEAGRRMIRDQMPDQHRELFEKLPTLWLATQDDAGQPWASIVAGAPGFVRSPDARHLDVATLPDPADPAREGLRPGAAIGLLGLEPHTRRRNRMNGPVVAVGPEGWRVAVAQSFGNCPKYIQARQSAPRVGPGPGQVTPEGPTLSAAARQLVAASDTLFIASRSSARGSVAPAGLDISHRGGRPGFVQLSQAADGGDLLTLPDYVGNFMFNTLGNLLDWPQAGLLFIDWQQGHALQLAVSARIEFDLTPADQAAHPGALRLLQLRVLRGWWRPHALPLTWTAPVLAPQFTG